MLQLHRPAPPFSWSSIALKGPDAADFLHRLTTLNIKRMQPGEGSGAFFLTAQGKVRAYFQLWMISREEFFFELDPGVGGKWKTELLNTIEQFHFGEKFGVESETPDLDSLWLLLEDSDRSADPALQKLSAKQFSESGKTRFFDHGKQDFGKSWITVWGPKAELAGWSHSLSAKPISADELEQLRISATRPRMDAEISENTIPLEVGLGLHDAISENKGCYPGQEVIERIISLGSPARRLGKIEGSGAAPNPGDAVKTPEGQEIGKVTSVARTPSGFEALAMIKKMHAKEGLDVSFASQPGSHARLVKIAPYA